MTSLNYELQQVTSNWLNLSKIASSSDRNFKKNPTSQSCIEALTITLESRGEQLCELPNNKVLQFQTEKAPKFTASNLKALKIQTLLLGRSKHTSMGSKCNMLSTAARVSCISSSLHIDFGRSKAQWSEGSIKHVNYHHNVECAQLISIIKFNKEI